MNKFLKINWACCLVLMLFIINCSNPGKIPKEDGNKKVIHFEEEWVQPPPDFDTLLLSSVTEFNQDGQPIEKFQYSKYDGSLIIHTKWTYDEQVNVVSKNTDNKEAGLIIQENFSYEYDKKGRKVKMLEKNSTNPDDIEHTYVYHNDGGYTDTMKIKSQLFSITDYNEDDKIVKGENFQQKSVLKNEYDEFGNSTMHGIDYLNRPDNAVTYTNEYDSLGNLIRKTLDDRYREYEYNENRDLIKETRFDEGGPYLKFIYKIKYFE